MAVVRRALPDWLRDVTANARDKDELVRETLDSVTGERAISHEPAGYDCPFCRLLRGSERGEPRAQDIVRETERALAFISPRWWPRNPGHVIVIPRTHAENLFEIAPADAHAVHDLTQEVAIAIRQSYGCAGISTRQHNEPVGGQDVWHFHIHVFPRYLDDALYSSAPETGFASTDRRLEFADRLRAHWARR